MVGMLKRMRHLKERVSPPPPSSWPSKLPQSRPNKPSPTSQLLDIRLGPGAMTISPTVRSIHLDFAAKLNQGHFGPRKFWHTYLPRLKYHNPAIPMTVNRTTDQAGPATLTVTFGPPSTTPGSNTANPGQSEQTTTRTIDMKHKHESTILSELTQMVEGKQVEATEEESAQLLELEDQRARSARDAERQKEVLRKKRREAAILEQARRSVEVQRG